MLKIFAVALLAIPLSVGSAQAMTKGHGHALPACSDGQQAKAACVCGTKDKSKHCSKDEYCHAFSGTCSK
jgi:hypothetical protein